MDKNLSLIDGTFENAAAIYRASKLQERESEYYVHYFCNSILTNKLNLVQADKEYVIRYFEQIGSVSIWFVWL